MDLNIRQRENDIQPKFNNSYSSTTTTTKLANSTSSFTKNILQRQQQQQQERPILSDKSNNRKGNDIQLKSSQIPGGNKIRDQDDKPIKKEDTQQVPKADKRQEEFDELVKDFFEDNETRYATDEPKIEIVPIIPIEVPAHLKHLFKKKPLSKIIGIKRTFEADEDEVQEHHKKLKLYKQKYLVPGAPPIELDTNDEAIAFDKMQETRAQNLMLQSKNLLQEVSCNDPMMVAEYNEEIFHNLLKSEHQKMADANYMDKQVEINWSTRGVLIDWVIEVHYLFQLLPETLFLAVNIIDRFLSRRTVALGKMQLVGTAALFIATKFEEMCCPALEDFLYMTGDTIEEDELVRAECFILSILDFELCYANPMNFLRRLLNEDPTADVYTRTLSKYFMEVCYIDHRLMTVRPSLMAAASVCLARKMLGRTKWTSDLIRLSGYTLHDVKPIVEILLDYLSQPVVHDAFFTKWTSRKYSKASIFVRDWINRYYVSENGPI
ncbi:hypothetical protein RMATCC62417_08204 [Rhizopus microsporus]|nr:hypothetical protein RMATCC62417_08204 [Rhizopus microsporus]